MIEVVLVEDGWTWMMIGFCGRPLAYTAERFPSDHAAMEAAKRYRVALWAIGDTLDHRMGACM